MVFHFRYLYFDDYIWKTDILIYLGCSVGILDFSKVSANQKPFFRVSLHKAVNMQFNVLIITGSFIYNNELAAYELYKDKD